MRTWALIVICLAGGGAQAAPRAFGLAWTAKITEGSNKGDHLIHLLSCLGEMCELDLTYIGACAKGSAIIDMMTFANQSPGLPALKIRFESGLVSLEFTTRYGGLIRQVVRHRPQSEGSQFSLAEEFSGVMTSEFMGQIETARLAPITGPNGSGLVKLECPIFVPAIVKPIAR